MTKTGKRRLSKTSMVYIAIGVLLISLMTIVGMSAFLRTKDIIVEGASMYSAEEVVDASGVNAGDNLLFVNTQNVSLKIREELPFVSVAEVSRRLPDKVIIEITESEAIASVVYAGEVYVIDSAARVLARTYVGDPEMPVVLQNLIEIRGAEIEETDVGSTLKSVFGSEIKLQYMQDILEALEREEQADDVSYLDVSNIVNVYFGYLGRYRVILGGRENLRPGNLRHNLERLDETVFRIEGIHPNTTGDINMADESGSPKFTPTG